MTLPVFDQCLELFDGFNAFLPGNGIIRSSEDR
jgi:hypothetical protein